MPSSWSPDDAFAVLAQFLAAVGLDELQPELVSFRLNAIFHLTTSGLALRIYGPGQASDRPAKMVACARLLEAQSFPAIRLARTSIAQPSRVLGFPLSVWKWIASDDSVADVAFEQGRLLRRFHDLPQMVGLTVPVFDPGTSTRRRLQRLRDSAMIKASDCDVLSDALSRVLEQCGGLARSALGSSLIHGDATPGNFIASRGQLLMIDLDSVAYGAREWDLAPMHAMTTRYGPGQQNWHRFLAGYSVAEKDLPDVEAASLMKQLTMTTYLCLSAGRSDAIDAEIARRVRMWADWDLQAQWQRVLGTVVRK